MNSLDMAKDAGPLDNGNYFRSANPSMRGLDQVISDIAPTDIPVLLVGESGSGKEVMAMHIHHLSRRRGEPFLKLSCPALSPEFFDRRQEGLHLNGSESGPPSGTVFLDEINELEAACQSKLLHFLPEEGTAKTQCLGLRVISASARSLEEEMVTGRFREDLYYRINGVCLRLPPLRQRKDDIPPLVDFLLKKYSVLFGYPERTLSPQSLQILLNHQWPGNIRELENSIKKVVALGDEQLALAELSVHPSEVRAGIGSGHFPDGRGRGHDARLSLKETARAASHVAERELILKVLTQTRWNRKRAAKELQISYKALLYKLKQIGMDEASGSMTPWGEQG